MADSNTARYYDLGMVDTQQTDLPDGIPTGEEMRELFERIEGMSMTRPLAQVYEKVKAKLPFEGGWEGLTFEEQNGILLLFGVYNAQLRDNAKALSDQAT